MYQQQKEEQIRLIWAFLVSFLVLFVSHTYFAKNNSNSIPQAAIPAIVEAIKPQPRAEVSFNNSFLAAKINLRGAFIDDVQLLNYKESSSKDASTVKLLTPGKDYAKFGFDTNENNLWQITSNTLNSNGKITLKLVKDNREILRTFAFDDSYSVKISDKITNLGKQPQKVAAQYIFNEVERATEYGFNNSGLVSRILGKQVEESYRDLAKGVEESGKVEWFGLSSIYFFKAFILNSPDTTKLVGNKKENIFTIANLISETELAPQKSMQAETTLFIGPKQVSILRKYAKTLEATRFELAIDYGFWFFLTKPFLNFLNWLANFTHNYGLAILIFTLLLKIITYPITRSSLEMSAKMKELQPQILRISQVYASDPMRRNMEMAALYKKHQVNPLSGCLPMLIQIPIFFALYKVLTITIELRHAPFFGWIHDLSVADPSNIFNLFGLLPFTPPHMLHIGIWPIIMGLTMWLQQKSTMQSMDPHQANIMKWLPLFLTFVMSSVPVGIIIYWSFSNVLTILQQFMIKKHLLKK